MGDITTHVQFEFCWCQYLIGQHRISADGTYLQRVVWIHCIPVKMGQYQYDENGVTFNYFLLSVLSLFLLPTTITLIYSNVQASKGTIITYAKSSSKHILAAKATKSHCNCQSCKERTAKLATIKRKKVSNQGFNYKYECY